MGASFALRKLVFERDQGVCAGCLADCERIKRVYWAIVDFEAQCLYAQLLQLWEDRRAFWEADHIHETADGGPDSLDNLQTLCVGCHRAKTSASSTARALRAEEDRRIQRAQRRDSQAQAALASTVRRVTVKAERSPVEPAPEQPINQEPSKIDKIQAIAEAVNTYLARRHANNPGGVARAIEPIAQDCYDYSAGFQDIDVLK